MLEPPWSLSGDKAASEMLGEYGPPVGQPAYRHSPFGWQVRSPILVPVGYGWPL
jgi:hypothetical protein